MLESKLTDDIMYLKKYSNTKLFLKHVEEEPGFPAKRN